MAKGLTSAYVPLGAVGLRRKIADHFEDKVFPSGLTYNSHPLGCAAALAALAVYEEDKLIARAKERGVLMRSLLDDLAAKHPSVGAVRSIGLFGIVELCSRQSEEAAMPFAGRRRRWPRSTASSGRRSLHVRPMEHLHEPATTITEDELREGLPPIAGWRSRTPR
jgi:taurine--2-oxoglutarate transaminase